MSFWKHRYPLLLFVLALLAAGCSAGAVTTQPSTVSSSPEENPEEYIEYNGIYKKRSELSEDTIKWVEWYHTLPEEQQLALNMVPSEFHSQTPGGTAMETENGQTAEKKDAPAYHASLTEDELLETEELARFYFTELTEGFDGVEFIEPAPDDDEMYHNTGLEAEYPPGNIIIYRVLTEKDQKEGHPMRSISIARRSKTEEWKVINAGF